MSRRRTAAILAKLYTVRWHACWEAPRSSSLDSNWDGFPWILTAKGSFAHLSTTERGGRTIWREPQEANDNSLQWGSDREQSII